jgi:CelD/BcsL family acetyltransferase involved in cellulose biosynthesis
MHMKNVVVISGRDLDATLARAWATIQLANPDLSSPFFTPEFTRIIATVRDDVEVAVIAEEGQPVAFLPFRRSASDPSRAAPVADSFSDFEALICDSDFTCDPLELIQECGLVTYNFTKFLASQKSFAPFHRSCDISPQMDLSQGYDAYAEEKRAAGSKLISDCGRKASRMEREVGPLHFVAHSADTELLRQVLTLKSNQYLRTGVPDVLSYDWVRAMIETTHETQTDNFGGMLSLLYAGNRLVAGHFGMRSRGVWHSWLPVYDTEMAKYSPGLILLLKMAAYAPSAGLHTIDLDRGGSLYKMRLMSRAIIVASGSVDRRYSRRIAQRAWNLRMAVAKSPLTASVRPLVRWARRLIRA